MNPTNAIYGEPQYYKLILNPSNDHVGLVIINEKLTFTLLRKNIESIHSSLVKVVSKKITIRLKITIRKNYRFI